MGDLGKFKEEMKRRTKEFAHKCVKLALSYPENSLGNHLRRQLIKSSTSISANYRASCIAQTVPQIITKLSIAIEEADESEFWIEFAMDENLSFAEESVSFINEAHEIASILIKSRMTLQSKKNSLY